MKLDGFGKRSVDKLLEAIETSRLTTMANMIRSLGIDLIGRSASKDLAKLCNNDIKEFNKCISGKVDFSTKIDGFGEKMNKSLYDWFRKKENLELYKAIYKEVTFKVEEKTSGNNTGVDLNNQTFCITGKLVHYANRDALVAEIQNHNGKYVNSVSSKLDWLINNDTTSQSGKNKKMHELGKSDRIISEKDFMKMIGV
jgi:DNA ligase (NAD+)